ncbi:T9SS type A sorting domain-containing protein [Ilyomonas limi]|uniref:T9SS type A sorting domain-containing protein n=1 Tax=Ilyomonas limi TaxID=2575867 RepID=A0A4U3KV14_9BACT|nr:Calx-beta domain-containing protein [Ilyomonas limi]TKK65384.1 T9SS type A sorting domain-containing protein [Ilyomonas limi]
MNKVCLLLLFYFYMLRAVGQAGTLDSSFGNNGIQAEAVFTNLNLLNEQGREVLTSTNGDIFLVIQVEIQNDKFTRIVKYLPDGRPDPSYGNAGYSNAVNLNVTSAAMLGGKIEVAGYVYNLNSGNFDYDIALARFTANGKLDSAFGENGRVTTDFNGYADVANSVTLQADKIIVAGSSNNDFALARYTTDGILDSTFGVNGKVTTDFYSYEDYANAIALQGNKIIVAGYSRNTIDFSFDFALARYTADGMADSSFRENGRVTANFKENASEYANAIMLQGDKIVVAGNTDNASANDNDFALARYTADGILDSVFGENGMVTTDFNSLDDVAYSIALQENKVVVGGANGNFILARYTIDGMLDASFGKNGKVTTGFNSPFDGANSIALQGNKIIAGGFTTSSNYDFALARYAVDGVLDASFGENGKLTGYIASTKTYFTATAIQASKIVAAGYAINAYNNTDFVLARYTLDGTLDSSFGENGSITTDFDSSDEEAYSLVFQEDKIIVVGYNYNANAGDFNFALVRYTKDGKLDSAFGVNGKVTTDFSYGDFANSVALQGDKIIVAGYTYNSSADASEFTVARYNTDGALDSTFGQNGKVTADFINISRAIRNSVVLQGDKIIVAGYTFNPKTYDNNNDFALIRYTADGTPDSSFGENGRVITDFNSLYDDDFANSITLQRDKIIVAGYTVIYEDEGYTTSTIDFALARYTANGVLDTSFGVNGRVTTDFDNTKDGANSVALQGDKIISGGYTFNPNANTNDFALVRYTADGALDSSFGVNGKIITPLGGSASVQAIAVHQNRLYAAGSLTLLTGETYGVIAAYQLEAPEPTISIADVVVSESKKLAVVTVRLSAPVNHIVRVHFTTRDKTATGNQDYISVNGPLFFIPGLNRTAKVFIPLIDDNQHEGNEEFEIVFTNALHATIEDSIGIVTILDNDNILITKQSTSLHIITSSNPSADGFTLQLLGNNLKQPVSIWVYDVSGRLVEERKKLFIGQSLRLGNQYNPGTYIIEAVQGSQRALTKVIKTGK